MNSRVRIPGTRDETVQDLSFEAAWSFFSALPFVVGSRRLGKIDGVSHVKTGIQASGFTMISMPRWFPGDEFSNLKPVITSFPFCTRAGKLLANRKDTPNCHESLAHDFDLGVTGLTRRRVVIASRLVNKDSVRCFSGDCSAHSCFSRFWPEPFVGFRSIGPVANEAKCRSREIVRMHALRTQSFSWQGTCSTTEMMRKRVGDWRLFRPNDVIFPRVFFSGNSRADQTRQEIDLLISLLFRIPRMARQWRRVRATASSDFGT